MAAVEAILEKLRRAAAHRGPEWLRQQVGDIGDEEPSGSAAGEVSYRVRRSRPPARFSPGPTSQPVQSTRSPREVRSVPPGEAETRHGGPRAVYTPPAELGGRGHGPTWHRFPAWGEQAKSIRGAKENSGRDGEEPSRALEDGPRQ